MRRTFLRIRGSPQASTTVETPAHYAPTLFNGVWFFLSEVVIGNVEPIMSCASYETQCKDTKYIPILYGKDDFFNRLHSSHPHLVRMTATGGDARVGVGYELYAIKQTKREPKR